LAITVNNIPTTPIITLNVNILHSNSATGNQWYNQNGLISGAINQDYTPLIDGDYYVIVTLNGCSSNPSNTIHVTITGIEKNELSNFIRFYPNPITNKIIIENSKTTMQNYIVTIKNIQGQEMLNKNITQNTNQTIDVSKLENGIYFLTIHNDKENYVSKILIQK
jgi:hypothetical protein